MNKKICAKCQNNLPINDFYKQTGRKNGASFCKKCFNIYCNERWQKRKLEAIEYMGGCCAKCGYNKCPDVLEFHHLDESTKDFDWGKLRLRSKETILTELDKCTMLCANCHRETHYELNRKN